MRPDRVVTTDGVTAEMPYELWKEVCRDAERYRYLRQRDLDTIQKGGVFAGQTPQNLVLNGDDLDSAVDAGLASSRTAAELVAAAATPDDVKRSARSP